MILTVAIDKGFIFTVIIAIITSVISAVYYLILIKNIYFEKSEYKYNNKIIQNINKNVEINNYIKYDNIILSSCFIINNINYNINNNVFYIFWLWNNKINIYNYIIYRIKKDMFKYGYLVRLQIEYLRFNSFLSFRYPCLYNN